MNLFNKDRSFTGKLLDLPNPKLDNINNYHFIKFKESFQSQNSSDYFNLEARQKAIDDHKYIQLKGTNILKGKQNPFSLRLLDEFKIFNYHDYLQNIQERTVESTTFAIFSEIREKQDDYLKYIYKLDLEKMIEYINVEDWGNVFLDFFFNFNFIISNTLISKILTRTKEFIEFYFKEENELDYKEYIDLNFNDHDFHRSDWTEIQNLDLIEERKQLFKLLPKYIQLETFLESKTKYERIKKAEAISFLEKEGKIILEYKENKIYILKENKKDQKNHPRSLLICSY